MSKHVDDLYDDEVSTGADLLSGTTVGGNTVYHLGNDGAGSGLDAETVDGGTPVVKNVTYNKSKEFSNVGTLGSLKRTEAFSTIYNNFLSFDNNECIWSSGGDRMEKTDQSYNNVTTFFAPSYIFWGHSIDSDNCVWAISDQDGDTDSDEPLWKFDHSGTVITSYSPAQTARPRGMSFDSDGSLWISDDYVNRRYDKTKTSTGSVIKSVATPSTGAIVDFDVASGDSIYSPIQSNIGDPGCIFKINQSGTIVGSFNTPSSDPTGIAVTNDETEVWHHDNSAGSGGSIYVYENDEKFDGYSLNKL